MAAPAMASPAPHQAARKDTGEANGPEDNRLLVAEREGKMNAHFRAEDGKALGGAKWQRPPD